MTDTIVIFLFMLVFLISGGFFLVTAYVYYSSRQIRDIEGKCIFYSTLTQGALCLLIVSFTSLVDQYCFPPMILLILAIIPAQSYSMWFTVLTYHVRKTIKLRLAGENLEINWTPELDDIGSIPCSEKKEKQQLRLDELKLPNNYLISVYGIPVLSMAFCIIQTISLSGLSCNRRSELLTISYVISPVIIMELARAYLLVSLHRLLWNAQPVNSVVDATSIMEMKSRFALHAKLFLISGLPRLIVLTAPLIGNFGPLAAVGAFFLCFEGIFMFYSMVVKRQRVCKNLPECLTEQLKHILKLWNEKFEKKKSLQATAEDSTQFI